MSEPAPEPAPDKRKPDTHSPNERTPRDRAPDDRTSDDRTPEPAHDPLAVPAADYARLADAIASDASPVGIDAKKTHILILHRLTQIEHRLTRIEQQLNRHTPQ